MARRTMPWLVTVCLAAGCSPAAPEHVGAATPLPVDHDAELSERMRFPKEDLQTLYELLQLERCGPRCVYARDGKTRLLLDMRADGTVGAADHGALRETFRSVAGITSQLLEWKRSWQGRWRGDRGSLQLDLEQGELSCRRTGKDGEGEASCNAQPLELDCQAVEVVLQPGPAGTETSWVCEPRRPIESIDTLTPFPWVFGMHRPLVASDAGTVHQPKRGYRLAKGEGEPPKSGGKPAAKQH